VIIMDAAGSLLALVGLVASVALFGWLIFWFLRPGRRP